MTATKRFAIQGNHLPLGNLEYPLHPPNERLFKRLGIQNRKYPTKGIFRYGAGLAIISDHVFSCDCPDPS